MDFIVQQKTLYKMFCDTGTVVICEDLCEDLSARYRHVELYNEWLMCYVQIYSSVNRYRYDSELRISHDLQPSKVVNYCCRSWIVPSSDSFMR